MTDPQPSTTKKVKDEIKKEVEKIPSTTDQHLMGALSYLWLISLVMLLVKKNDEFVQFHAKQGLVLFIGSLLGFIPIIGWLAWFGSVVGMVVGFIHAWQGKKYEIPFVYKLSQKINL